MLNKKQEKQKKQELDYLDLLSCKFKFNGTSIEEGFDCMTFIIEMGKRRGIKIPNINHVGITLEESSSLFKVKEHFDLFEEVKKDKDTLVLMKNPFGVIGHVGYMLDKNSFIHMTKDYGVQVTRVIDRVYKNKIVGFYLPKET